MRACVNVWSWAYQLCALTVALYPPGREFVQRLLAKNAKDRISAKDALAHPWMSLDLPPILATGTLSQPKPATMLSRKGSPAGGPASATVSPVGTPVTTPQTPARALAQGTPTGSVARPSSETPPIPAPRSSKS